MIKEGSGEGVIAYITVKLTNHEAKILCLSLGFAAGAADDRPDVSESIRQSFRDITNVIIPQIDKQIEKMLGER